MSISKRYIKEISKNLKYLPTWLPTVRVSPGDVGTMTAYQYTHITNLKDMGIDYETEEAETDADFEYQSKGSVTIETKLAGEGTDVQLGETEAVVKIDFNREHAIVFRTMGCSSSRLTNLDRVARQVLRLYEYDKWPKDYIVVTEAISATSATILVSSGNSAEVQLLTNNKLRALDLNLASIEANFRIIKQDNIGMSIVARSGLNPFFRTCGIKKKWFRAPQFRNEPSFGLSTADQLDIIFGEVTYDMYETKP